MAISESSTSISISKPVSISMPMSIINVIMYDTLREASFILAESLGAGRLPSERVVEEAMASSVPWRFRL